MFASLIFVILFATSILGLSVPSSNDNKKLVCLVTGASRGIGKGIALELGTFANSFVYITGTNRTALEQTANEIPQGIPCVCDHNDDAQVQAVLDRIQKEHGKLDILINNCFQLPANNAFDVLNSKFYEQDTDVWDTLHGVGLRSHFVTTQKAMPLLFAARNQIASSPIPRPFIGMVSSFGGLTYTFNVAYSVAKAALDRMVKDFAVDLDGENITVMSLYPGVVKTERTLEMIQSGEWDEKVKIPLENAESPRFTGRAVARLAQDPRNSERTGTVQVVAEVAEEYGFTDIDGSQPPSIRSLRFLLPAYGMNKATRDKIPSWLIPNWKIPFSVMAQGGKPPSTKDNN